MNGLMAFCGRTTPELVLSILWAGVMMGCGSCHWALLTW